MPEQVMIVDIDPWVLKRAGIDYRTMNTGWKRAFMVSSADLQYLAEDQYKRVDSIGFFTRRIKKLERELKTRRIK